MRLKTRFIYSLAGLSIFGLSILGTAFSQTSELPEDTRPRVLFVCEHGAAKSIMAAAHFNKKAKELGLPHRAIARGTHPDAAFSPKAMKGLKEEGLDLPEGKPTLVGKDDVSGAIRRVTLGCTLPEEQAATDWNDIPSVSENYPAASRAIRHHVDELVRELAAKQKQAK